MRDQILEFALAVDVVVVIFCVLLSLRVVIIARALNARESPRLVGIRERGDPPLCDATATARTSTEKTQ